MKLSKVLLAVIISATMGFVSCSPKDADIKAAIDAKISATPDMAGANEGPFKKEEFPS